MYVGVGGVGVAGLIDEVYVHDVKSIHILQDFSDLVGDPGCPQLYLSALLVSNFMIMQSSTNFNDFKYSSSISPYNADFLGA